MAKRNFGKWLAAFAFTALAGTAAVAVAQPRFGGRHFGKKMMEHRINAHVDDALDAVAANPDQRVAVRAAVEHAMNAVEEGHSDRMSRALEGANLFAADKLDEQKVAELRAYHDRQAVKLTDAVIQSVYDIHGALTSAQRKQLVAYIKSELPNGGAGGGWREKFFTSMIDDRLNDMFDELKATPEQRQKLTSVKDSVVGAWFAGKGERKALLDQSLALFEKDTLDKGEIARLRATHLTRIKTVADRVEAAVRTVHQTLTPEQRKAAVQLVRSHHQKMKG